MERTHANFYATLEAAKQQRAEAVRKAIAAVIAIELPVASRWAVLYLCSVGLVLAM
jgi:hypothetical protein